MTLERFRALCVAQPGATEQIQWRVDAVFKVGGKMFAVACTDFSDYPDVPVCSFKCDDETFAALCEREGIVPAPYMARSKWVALREWSALSEQEFAPLVARGHALVRAGLPKKVQAALIGAALAVCVVLATPAWVAAQTRTPADWVALKQNGFAVPAGEAAAALLVEMTPLLASPDPVQRDDVAFSAAEKWIVRDRVVAPADLRRLAALWSDNLDDGLGTAGDDRIFKRSFSALALSLVAAREVATPFLTAAEAQQLFDRLLDYFARERDLRGFDPAHGWMHAVAHTADAFKFLARGSHWTSENLPRLLEAVHAKIVAHDVVFTWGETERLAAAVHAAVRRPDADAEVAQAWIARWPVAHAALWANGPQVKSDAFARVENAKQTLRSLHALLAMESSPTPPADAVRRAALAALARMR